MAGCAVFGGSVVVRFLPDKRKLKRTMSRAGMALEKMQQRLATTQASIKLLQTQVEMIPPVHERLSDYHEQLTELRLEADRKEMAEEVKNPDGSKRHKLERV